MNDTRMPPDDRLNAFCPDSRAYLQGADEGPSGRAYFRRQGHLRRQGPRDRRGQSRLEGQPERPPKPPPGPWRSWSGAGATMVGKTHTDELTRGILGVNAHYGTPLNPQAPGRVPGGSSSGSAAAVAGGLVDFALGSDTGGSVRIPASFCGLYGLRPTHGRIPLDGMLLQAPSYDTVGWFARDAGPVCPGGFGAAADPDHPGPAAPPGGGGGCLRGG